MAEQEGDTEKEKNISNRIFISRRKYTDNDDDDDDGDGDNHGKTQTVYKHDEAIRVSAVPSA